MSSQGQPTQPDGGYHSQPQKQDPQDDQQQGEQQVRVAHHQQHPPQPQWNMGQQHQAPYFALPPQQMASTDSPQQLPAYGNMPYQHQFPPMGFAGYHFPTPPPAPGYQYPPPPQMLAPSPYPGESPQPPDQQQGRHGSPEQHQSVPPQDLQHAPQQLQQGHPQQFQNYPHPQQYPYGWFMPGSIGGYNQFYPGGPMRTGSHEPTPDATLHAPAPHHGQSGSPAPKFEQQMPHVGYGMGGAMSLGAPAPFHAPPAASASMPPPANTSQPHDADTSAAEPEHANSTNSAPITASRETLASSAAPATHGSLMGAQSSSSVGISDHENSESSTAAAPMPQHPKIPSPPPPYGDGATHPAFQCSPETQRLHAKAAAAATAAGGQPPNIHVVKHLSDCTACEGSSRRRKKSCDRQWPCVNCCRENRRWSACKYIPRPEDDEDDDEEDRQSVAPPLISRRSSMRAASHAATARMAEMESSETEQLSGSSGHDFLGARCWGNSDTLTSVADEPDAAADAAATSSEGAAEVETGGSNESTADVEMGGTEALQSGTQPYHSPSPPVASPISSEADSSSADSPSADTPAAPRAAPRLSSYYNDAGVLLSTLNAPPQQQEAEEATPAYPTSTGDSSSAQAEAQMQMQTNQSDSDGAQPQAPAQSQPQATNLVNLALPPELIAQLMQQNPLFAQALAGQQAQLQSGTSGAPDSTTQQAPPQQEEDDVNEEEGQEEQPASPQEQPASPQDTRTFGPDGPISFAQLAAQREREGEDD